ncbi:hypothetical protein ACSBQT_10945 [Brevibacterium sp. H602]|uniref:hypothetical protein n=1 Tax=Brevibacterium sp. H602 TaxID=3444316 RepID=UPI003EBD79CC
MTIGYRVRDLDDFESGLTVGDMLDFVEHAHEGMAIYRILNPDWSWSLTNLLLAEMLDAQVLWRWVDGGKRGPKPKPIPRPGVTETHTKSYTVSETSTVDEIDEWLKGRVKTG